LKIINLNCVECGKKIKRKDIKYKAQGTHEGSMWCLKCDRRLGGVAFNGY